MTESDALTLTLKKDGSVELTDDTGKQLWSSDNDDDFSVNFDDIADEDDLEDIADWLEDNGQLDESLALFYIVESDEDENEDDDD